MEPTLRDGCWILINQEKREPEHGKILVIRTEDDGVIVKRTILDEEEGWLVASDNPDKKTWRIRLAGDSSTNTGRNSRNGLGTLEVPNGNGAVNCIGSIGASPLRVTIPAWVGRS